MYTNNVNCDKNSGFVERLVRTSIECELETLTNPFVRVGLFEASKMRDPRLESVAH